METLSRQPDREGSSGAAKAAAAGPGHLIACKIGHLWQLRAPTGQWWCDTAGRPYRLPHQLALAVQRHTDNQQRLVTRPGRLMRNLRRLASNHGTTPENITGIITRESEAT